MKNHMPLYSEEQRSRYNHLDHFKLGIYVGMVSLMKPTPLPLRLGKSSPPLPLVTMTSNGFPKKRRKKRSYGA